MSPPSPMPEPDPPPPAPLSDAERGELAARLAQRQAELESSLAALETPAAAVELDQTRVGRLSRMDAMQQQAQAQAARARAGVALQRVRAARQRLQTATYGRCLDCEQTLDLRRLRADPCATLCLDCQAEREAEAAAEDRRRQMQGRR